MIDHPVRFKPMADRVAIIADYNGLWVQHEFTVAEAMELAGTFARATLDAAKWGESTSAAWDLTRKK